MVRVWKTSVLQWVETYELKRLQYLRNNSDEISVYNNITSGIHGGYRLVSTYDLLDSKPTGRVFQSKLWSSQIWRFSLGGRGVFQSKLWSSQIWSFSFGGGFRSKLWSSQIWSFSLGGGYFRVNFGYLKSEVFHWGGLFRSKLWSSQIWSFSLGGGLFGLKFLKAPFLSGEFGQKWLFEVNCTQTCLCITDSLSHTTYVETKNRTHKPCLWINIYAKFEYFFTGRDSCLFNK